MSDDKPREFWIRPREFWIESYIDKPAPNVAHRYLHVIEYSAYEKLQKERDQALEMCEKLAKALELAIAQAGIPDAGGACRVILKTNGEALKEYREWKGK